MRKQFFFLIIIVLFSPNFSFADNNPPTFSAINKTQNSSSVTATGTVFSGFGNITDVEYQVDDISGLWSSATVSNTNNIAEIDSSFENGSGGGLGANEKIKVLETTIDGKITIGGDFTTYNGVSRNRIARLNSDGSLDTSFDPGTGVNSTVHSICIQNDGKILISGSFATYNEVSRNGLARLNSDGSLDITFNPVISDEFTDVFSLAVQDNGKILIGGGFTTYDGVSRNGIARLNSDGSLDTSFDPGTGASAAVYDIYIQDDGKILIGGGFTTYDGVSRNGIARLNSDGSLDTSFDPGTGVNGAVFSFSLQVDNKIIIGGYFTTYNSSSSNNIARLNSDGSLDTSFDIGAGADWDIYSTGIQDDGKILISGYLNNFNNSPTNYIARLNSNGSLDSTFNTEVGADNLVNSFVILPDDGKILIGGSFISYNGEAVHKIARLNSNGTFDPSFNSNTGSSNIINSIAIQSDDKIIVVGHFIAYNDTSVNHVARLNSDGSLDTAFSNSTGANDLVYIVKMTADQKIFIGGDFTTYNGVSRNRIARLNSDGSLDTSFDPGIGANNVVYGIYTLEDGKLLISGDFTTYNGVSRNRIARLNSDGSLDTSFDPGTGTNGFVYITHPQPDGKILIGGSFTTYNGVSRNNIARLNSDGSLDTSFIVGTGAIGNNNEVFFITMQFDEKIIISGSFNQYNSFSVNNIARLNLDGSLDTDFNIEGTGANEEVVSISIQPDNKIILGGQFSTYNDITRNNIARLNSDGSLDTSFDPGTGTNGFVYSTIIQSDSKILIGGAFTSYNSTPLNYLFRTFSTGSADFSIVQSISELSSGSHFIYIKGTDSLLNTNINDYAIVTFNIEENIPSSSSRGGGMPLYVLQQISDKAREEKQTTATTIQGCAVGNLFSIITEQKCLDPTISKQNIKKTYNFGIKTLKKGSRGEAVKELQRFLNDNLNSSLIIDGILGPKTIAVIKKWQKENILISDGLVGSKTKAKMMGI